MVSWVPFKLFAATTESAVTNFDFAALPNVFPTSRVLFDFSIPATSFKPALPAFPPLRP